jgi:hypothetical protein
MFKRDPKNVRVTASNVYDLLDAAKGDQELSRAILDKLNVDSDDTLKRAAIKAANQAAGISTVVLENVGDLIDAADANKDDREAAFRKVAENIQRDIANNDIVDIAKQLTDILEKTVVVPSEDPKRALINTGEIAVSVPMDDNSGNTARVTIDVNNEGTGTVTIATPGGQTTEYPCEITDGDTITLTKNGEEVEIGYEINNGALTLTDLDDIDIPGNAGLADQSEPSEEPIRIEFEEGFIDSVPESDLTLLVITLILAKADSVQNGTDEDEGMTLEEYFDTWQTKNVETGEGLDKEERLIAAIVNGMISRGELTGEESELTKMLRDLLEQNKDK